MKDKNIKGDPEFEKKLREKMKELSSNVDCFDKISSRAFPETDSDFSDSEFTVSDLENVTGKRRIVPILKWTAAATAVVICVGILPKTVFVQEFLSNIRRNDDAQFRNIVAEIKNETGKNTYEVYDMPLKQYIIADVLVTPFFSCPFNDIDNDTNVRIFVRKIDDTLTNQVYAVEYAGDYSSENFIAAAESAAKFTEDDIKQLKYDHIFGNNDEAINAVKGNFTPDKYGFLTDKDGKNVCVASFDFDCFYKDDTCIAELNTQVLYSKDVENTEKYLYDILTTSLNNGGDTYDVIHYELPVSGKMWKRSLRFDGSNDMPAESGSEFVKTNFFGKEEADDLFGVRYYEPYVLANSTLYMTNDIHRIKIGNEAYMGDIFTPAFPDAKRRMRVYIPFTNFMMFSSQADPKFDAVIETNDGEHTITVHNSRLEGDMSVEAVFSDEEIDNIINEQAAQQQKAYMEQKSIQTTVEGSFSITTETEVVITYEK